MFSGNFLVSNFKSNDDKKKYILSRQKFCENEFLVPVPLSLSEKLFTFLTLLFTCQPHMNILVTPQKIIYATYANTLNLTVSFLCKLSEVVSDLLRCSN